MLFGKKNDAVPKRGEANPGRTAHDDDLARDAVAAILRTLGELALPTAAVPKEQFVKRCEALAKSVLIQNDLDEQTGEPVRRDRVYAEVLHGIREQRRAESSEYATHRESAHIIVSDLVTGLKRSLEKRQGHDRETVSLLAEMEQVVDQGDLASIKRVCGKTAKHIRHVITIQREQDRAELASLSDQLRSMRAELKTAKDQMQRDPLTELLNRGAFDDTFDKMVEIAHTSASDLTLFMLDLDRFKTVNDTLGHQAGDEVLKAVSKQLIRCFPRKDDLVVRYGGEEFAVLCRHTGIEDAYFLGERVRKAVEKLEIDLDDLYHHQTISVGYAVLNPNESPEKFLKRADAALYTAKKNGRNQVAPPP
jgi:diguanylate cyclase